MGNVAGALTVCTSPPCTVLDFILMTIVNTHVTYVHCTDDSAESFLLLQSLPKEVNKHACSVAIKFGNLV